MEYAGKIEVPESIKALDKLTPPDTDDTCKIESFWRVFNTIVGDIARKYNLPAFQHNQNGIELDLDYYQGLVLREYFGAHWKDGLVYSYLSVTEYYKGKPMQGIKPGKFIKKFSPHMKDSQVESLAQSWKEFYAEKEYDLVESKDSVSFAHAYESDYVPKRNPSFDGFSFDVKRLDASCMRGKWDNSPIHPASVYGAGDLAIVYASDKATGNIGARVIVWPDKLVSSAIYLTDRKAGVLIQDYLTERGYKPGSFWGAKLKRIESDRNNFLMPYVDDCISADLFDDHLIISKYGDINIQCTSGFTSNESQFYCDSCGDSCNQDDLVYMHGTDMCWHCVESSYTYSELMDEYIDNDSAESNGAGDYATRDYFENNGFILDCDCIWQEESECIEFEGEYYHESHLAVVRVEHNYYHKDSDEYKAVMAVQDEKDKVKSGAYEVKESVEYGWKDIPEPNIYGNTQLPPTMGLHVTTEIVLRQNYQLNEQGIPERLPELPFDLVDLNFEITCVD